MKINVLKDSTNVNIKSYIKDITLKYNNDEEICRSILSYVIIKILHKVLLHWYNYSMTHVDTEIKFEEKEDGTGGSIHVEPVKEGKIKQIIEDLDDDVLINFGFELMTKYYDEMSNRIEMDIVNFVEKICDKKLNEDCEKDNNC